MISNRANIAIVGAGPIGLYLALRLNQLGFEKITLIDKRVGEYIRSGYYIDSIFEKLSKYLNLPVQPSTSFHIKDIERSLLEHITKTQIQIIKQNFISIENKNIILEKNLKLPADIIFDCTGTSRKVINEINRLNPKQPPFKIQAIGDNPQKFYLSARLIMQPEDAEKFSHKFDETDPFYLLYLEKLRELGWQHHCAPYAYIKSFPKKNSHLVKVNLYSEAPEYLSPTQQLLWLKNIIELNTNDALIHYELQQPSRKHLNKPMVTHFKVEPHMTSPALWSSENSPLILHAGDATMNTFVRLARGLAESVERVNTFLECLEVKNGAICSIKESSYQTKLNSLMEKAKSEILTEYQTIRERRRCDYYFWKMRYNEYKKFHAMYPQIKKGFAIVTKLFAESALQEAISKYLEIKNLSGYRYNQSDLASITDFLFEIFELNDKEWLTKSLAFSTDILNQFLLTARQCFTKPELLFFDNSARYYQAVYYTDFATKFMEKIVQNNLTLPNFENLKIEFLKLLTEIKSTKDTPESLLPSVTQNLNTLSSLPSQSITAKLLS